MNTWEYTVVERKYFVSVQDEVEFFNNMGKDRWELCVITDMFFYFKRIVMQ